ncbi:hypothetical protein CK231_00085 [Mesorhizobium loti]|uniref:hypothetical protein n=1 Tax=Mesorhizobium TaxID=68287 RepID=UPI000BAFE46D|nr:MULTISPECIES: hypothetical protein [Mesorhizobium]PBB15446.1 hypothetical protein CK231_00085 [Mesorhizobium loti]PBB95713.1 hypothetical protein CK224_24045 [Mesorhizobium sp. WSM3862]PBC07003.1 hypothetical protein CK230_29105 [Mesorhizobium sp. WSM3859]
MSFGNAVRKAVFGDAAELVDLLHSDRQLGQGERALLGDLVEELALRPTVKNVILRTFETP